MFFNSFICTYTLSTTLSFLPLQPVSTNSLSSGTAQRLIKEGRRGEAALLLPHHHGLQVTLRLCDRFLICETGKQLHPHQDGREDTHDTGYLILWATTLPWSPFGGRPSSTCTGPLPTHLQDLALGIASPAELPCIMAPQPPWQYLPHCILSIRPTFTPKGKGPEKPHIYIYLAILEKKEIRTGDLE